MRLVLLGPPGSGKGTQAAMLAAEMNVPHIATGDLFRTEMAEETELGVTAREYIANGNLVPDEIVNEMMRGRLAQADTGDFVLDGYPRTLEQAVAFDAMLEDLARPLCMAVDIDVPDEAIVDRAVGRLVCPSCNAIYHLTSKPPKTMGICDNCRGALVSRDDDRPSTVRHRLTVYHRITEPVREYYRSRQLLRTISGLGTRDEVAARLRAQLRNVC